MISAKDLVLFFFFFTVNCKDEWWLAYFTSYNTEEANTLLEVNASQNDKDFIAAINWKKIAEYVENGGGKRVDAKYAHNVYDDKSRVSFTSAWRIGVEKDDMR